MGGIIREMEAIKTSTEMMTEGPWRTSDGNMGDNAGGSGSIGTAKLLPLGLPLLFHLLPPGIRLPLLLTGEGKTRGSY
jgi:hypothetical protein